MTTDRNPWDVAAEAAMRGDIDTASRFAFLAIRTGCGNECQVPGVKRPGGQQTNGGCRCREMLLSVMRGVAGQWLCDVKVLQAADAWAEADERYARILNPERASRDAGRGHCDGAQARDNLKAAHAALAAAVKARKEARKP